MNLPYIFLKIKEKQGKNTEFWDKKAVIFEKDGDFEKLGFLKKNGVFGRTGFLKTDRSLEKHGVLTSLTWVFGRTGFLKKYRVFDVTNNVTTKDDLTTDSSDNQHGVNNECGGFQNKFQGVGIGCCCDGRFFPKSNEGPVTINDHERFV